MRYLVAVGLLVLSVAPAGATFSIVATDSATGEVGGAGTSCIGVLSASIMYAAVPGSGAIHAQAEFHQLGRDEAARLLGLGIAPADIVAQITMLAFDPLAQRRQYAVVDLLGQASSFTGMQNGAAAGDIQGSLDSFTYSVQGNTLTSTALLTQMQSAFDGTATQSGCDLAERLMLAIEAGAANGHGDTRCTNRNIPSDSAFLRIDRADGTSLIDIEVTNTGATSALVALRAKFDAWRASNACTSPAPPPSQCAHASPAAWLPLLVVLILALRLRSGHHDAPLTR